MRIRQLFQVSEVACQYYLRLYSFVANGWTCRQVLSEQRSAVSYNVADRDTAHV